MFKNEILVNIASISFSNKAQKTIKFLGFIIYQRVKPIDKLLLLTLETLYF